jgi:hypothetical protein
VKEEQVKQLTADLTKAKEGRRSAEGESASLRAQLEQVGVICHCHRIIGVVSVDYCIFVYNCVYYCDT